MLRYLLRGMFLRRLLRGSAHRRRSVWMTPRHGAHYARPRARSNVRVGGCCLPIPIGVLTGLVAGGTLARRRRG